MIHGIINVYKEKGFTSHDVVAKLRGMTKQRKIGHTGTLDPDATGVLPVCLGRATKLCDLLTDKDKTYETVLLLGVTTDTQDVSGEVLDRRSTKELTETQVREAVQSFVGEYDQIPPMYSALKVNGRKLYELAREGKTIERKARRVKIYEIEILEMQLPRVRMRVTCSKGTYIRTLCHDIGEKLSCGGCMEELVRTKVSRFEIGEAYTLDEISELCREEKLQRVVLPVDEMFSEYREVAVKEKWDSLVHNGNGFPEKAVLQKPEGESPTPEIQDKERVRVYDSRSHFIGIYEYRSKVREYRIVKMFFNKDEI